MEEHPGVLHCKGRLESLKKLCEFSDEKIPQSLRMRNSSQIWPFLKLPLGTDLLNESMGNTKPHMCSVLFLPVSATSRNNQEK